MRKNCSILILVIVPMISILCITKFSYPTLLAQDSNSPCLTIDQAHITFSLDGVPLNLCTSFLREFGFASSTPDSLIQNATATEKSPTYKVLSVTSIPYGMSAPTEGLPIAQIGSKNSYFEQLRKYREEQGGKPNDGPTILIFGETTKSIISHPQLLLRDDNLSLVEIIEWVAEAGNRIWIIRTSQELEIFPASLSSGNMTFTERTAIKLQLSSSNLNTISTSYAATQKQVQQPAQHSEETTAASTTGDLPWPSWWNGDCNINNHPGSSPIGAIYRSMKACGPGSHEWEVNFGVGVKQLEWQCAELSKRFLYLLYGIAPYSAHGKDVVNNYPSSNYPHLSFEKIANGTSGKAPKPNDVLSYGATTPFGHTSVVTSSNVDSNGNGTITVIEQNNSANGASTIQVSNWYVQGNLGGVDKWLHNTSDSNPPTPTPTRIPDGSTPTVTPGPTVPANAWYIDYYNDTSLSGPNEGTKCHSEWTNAYTYFFKDWGDGSPGGSCNDTFSARIRRHVQLTAGHYNFALFADDNARLEVLHNPGGNTVVDQWWATQHYESRDLSAGQYEILIVYRDTGGRALLSAWWDGPGYPAPPRQTRDPNQWYAELWPHKEWFWDPFAQYNDGNPLPLNKEWGNGSPGYGIQSDNFSTKYTRTYQFECGDYRFNLDADDYAELDVADLESNQIVHHLAVTQANNPVQSNSPVSLTGKNYEVRVKHKEDGGGARLYVNWTKLSSCATPTPAATATNTPVPTPTDTPTDAPPTFTPTTTPVPPPPTPVFGSGRDGNLVVNTGQTFTFCDQAPTFCTYMEQPANAAQPSITVNDSSGLTVGDELLIVHIRHMANHGAGRYEFANVLSKGGSGNKVIVLDRNLVNAYDTSATHTHSRVQVIKVPHFNNATINIGGTLSVRPWNDRTGGVIAMRVAGQLSIQGMIDSKGNPGPFGLGDGDNIAGGIGAGFAGGKSRNQHQQGYQGEGDVGPSYPAQPANGTGGGGGNTIGTANSGAGGGGGSHATTATHGTSTGQASLGEGAQRIVGNPELTLLFFGGGGGGGSMDQNAAGGPGGAGGGIVALFARQVTIQGSINADGGAGGYSSYSGGGGGAGGAVLIKAMDVNVGNNLITAIGGTGGTGSYGRGGNGGNGRIRIEYGNQYAGQTNPVASAVQVTDWVLATPTATLTAVPPTFTPIPTPTLLPITPIPSTSGELITSWEAGAGTWHLNVTSGAQSATDVAQYASEGNKAIKLVYTNNPDWSHFQYNFPATLNLSNAGKLQIHVVNPGTPLTLKISVPTGPNWAWHVSPGQSVPFGSKLMEFDLRTTDWSTDSGTGPIANLHQAQGLVILIEGAQAPNALYIDNLRKLAAAAATATNTPVPTATTPTATPNANGVTVNLPTNATGAPNTQVTIPVLLPNSVSGKGIVAYDFRITFDAAVLNITGIDTISTLSAGWNVTPNTNTPGAVQVVAFNTTPLAGTGTLINLIFQVTGATNTSTALTWTNFSFNEGIPTAQTSNGFFTVQMIRRVSGMITYHNTTRVMNGVTLKLSGASTQQATTNSSGVYSFTVQNSGTHVVTPSLSGRVNGISAFDAAYIAQCVANVRPISDCPLLAADSSGNNTLSAFDAAQVAQYTAGLAAPTSRVGNWHFDPTSRTYATITSDLPTENYTAYLIGEVTGNWQPPVASAATMSEGHQTTPGLTIITTGEESVLLSQSGTVTDLLAYQATIHYDVRARQFIEAVPVTGAAGGWQHIAHEIEPGIVTVVGYGIKGVNGAGPLVTLHFQQTGDEPAEFTPTIVMARRNEEPIWTSTSPLQEEQTMPYQLFLPVIQH